MAGIIAHFDDVFSPFLRGLPFDFSIVSPDLTDITVKPI